MLPPVTVWESLLRLDRTGRFHPGSKTHTAAYLCGSGSHGHRPSIGATNNDAAVPAVFSGPATPQVLSEEPAQTHSFSDSEYWNDPKMKQNASAVIWRHLVEDDTRQPPHIKAIIGGSLYGLGDLLAQVMERGAPHLHAVRIPELLCFMVLGAVFEGVINPWWDVEIERTIARTGSASAARVNSLRFFLNYLVWTPLCCEFYVIGEHIIEHGGHLDFFFMLADTFGMDEILGLHATAAPVNELDEIASDVISDIETTSAWQSATRPLSRWVPMPLRPLFFKLVEASSWTLI